MRRFFENKRVIYSLLLIILILGLGLRLNHLTKQSIWIDESYSIYHSSKDLNHIINLNDTSPPLYHTLLHLWTSVFGSSLYTARLLSVLFGILTIYAVFILCKNIFDPKIALLTAFFVAISPLQIYYSQEARNYELLFLLSIVSMYFFVKIIQDSKIKESENVSEKISSGIGLKIGYILSSTLLVYTHLYGVLIILAQNIFLLISSIYEAHAKKSHKSKQPNKIFSRLKELKIKKFRQWIFFDLIIFLLFVPWLTILPRILTAQHLTWIDIPSPFQIIYMIYNFFSGMVLSTYGMILLLMAIALIIISKDKIRSNSSYPKNINVLLWIWISIPILVPILYSFIDPIFVPRYVYFVSLPLLMILSFSIINLKKQLRISMIILITLLSLTSLINQDRTTTKDPWNLVYENVSKSDFKGSDIIFINYEELPSYAYYDGSGCFYAINVSVCESKRGVYTVDSIQDMEQIRTNIQNDTGVWVIISRGIYNPNVTNITGHLEQDFERTTYNEFKLNQNKDITQKFFTAIDKDSSARHNKIILSYYSKKVFNGSVT